MNLTATHFEQVVPASLKPFINISVAGDIPHSAQTLLVAFHIALQAIVGRIWVRRPIHVIVATGTFTIGLATGTLSYSPKPEVIGAYVDDVMVFIDWQKATRYELPLQVAIILEEFVHVLMNVVDERLVLDIVALLYDGVVINAQGQYVLPPSTR